MLFRSVTENDIYQLQTFDDTMQENVDKSEGMKIIPTPQGKTNAECLRSEERRVGKECRSRWSPYH